MTNLVNNIQDTSSNNTIQLNNYEKHGLNLDLDLEMMRVMMRAIMSMHLLTLLLVKVIILIMLHNMNHYIIFI